MPPYSHFEHLPYAHEPWRSLYVTQRVFTTLLLVPGWVIYYLILPRYFRPRESWSIKQIVAVNFTRRVYKVTERAGVTWGTRNPDKEPAHSSLKETRFEWIEPLTRKFRTGVLNDVEVPFVRVGVYIWSKQIRTAGLLDKLLKVHPKASGGSSVVVTPAKDPVLPASSPQNDVDIESASPRVPLIGMFMHGGGYCHMSAEEKSSTSRIPRRLIKDGKFTEIYSVEYRLLQNASFPAAIQDAATVYNHIVNRYGKTRVGGGCQIVLIGDSSGGNLVLGLARWIRDEDHLPSPDGLLLLSPSCDPSHAFPMTPSVYIPRPHERTDYLVDTPEPRALLQRTFLGHHPIEMIHSPYVSPASERVLRASYGDETWQEIAKQAGLRINQCAEDHFNKLQAQDKGSTEQEIPVNAAPSATSLNRAGKRPAPGESLFCHSNPNIPLLRRISTANPRCLNLFEKFPATCVVLGDAERLESEVMKLVGAMEYDGVRLNIIGVKDAPHDILIMRWWDHKVREEVWRRIDEWIKLLSMSRTI